MTHLFQAGDHVPVAYDAAAIAPGSGRAYLGPGGVVIVVRLVRPSPRQVEHVDGGAVAIGVRDRRGGESVLTVQVGEPGREGSFEVAVDAGSTPDGWKVAWWGEDVELALCDESTVVRAIASFVGPGTGLGDRTEGGRPPLIPWVAVYPESRFGLVQPHGRLDIDVWETLARALVYDRAWEPGFSEVWDLRAVDETVLRAADIERLVRLEVETGARLAGSESFVVMAPRRALTVSARFYAGLVRQLGRRVVVCGSAEEVARHVGIEEVPNLVGRTPAVGRGSPATRPSA